MGSAISTRLGPVRLYVAQTDCAVQTLAAFRSDGGAPPITRSNSGCMERRGTEYVPAERRERKGVAISYRAVLHAIPTIYPGIQKGGPELNLL
ncbi:hypothetical protein BH24ACI5_BH24ACI5_08890 [soil metagenome]